MFGFDVHLEILLDDDIGALLYFIKIGIIDKFN